MVTINASNFLNQPSFSRQGGSMKWRIVLCIFATLHLALLAGILVDSVLSRTAVEKAVEEGKNKLSKDMAEKIGEMKKEITSFNEDVFNTTRVN